MTGTLAALAAGLAAMLTGAGLAVAGFRAGDRPGDATVTAVVASLTQPDGTWPAAAVTVRNPGGTPVLVGLTARRHRMPRWLAGGLTRLGGGLTVTVPRRTTRSRFRAGRYAVSGVAGAGETACWLVPLAGDARIYRVVAVIGQGGRRLRVMTLPVAAATAMAQPAGLELTGTE